MENNIPRFDNLGGKFESTETAIENSIILDDLYKALREAKFADGSDKTFSAERVIKTIEEVRKTIKGSVSEGRGRIKAIDVPLTGYITNIHNIMYKAIELLDKETF